MGVFATRSPFRPNDIGLSCVKLERVVLDEKNGPMLYVAGVDLMDQTPIYDIKPYIPFTDSHPDAKGGFSDAVKDYELEVSFPAHLLAHFPEEKREAVIYVLKQENVEGKTEEEISDVVIGTGRYKFVEQVKEDHLDLTANEDYWI